MQAAIDNWRQVQAILTRMEQLSRQIIFTTLPDIHGRKTVTQRVLALD